MVSMFFLWLIDRGMMMYGKIIMFLRGRMGRMFGRMMFFWLIVGVVVVVVVFMVCLVLLVLVGYMF